MAFPGVLLAKGPNHKGNVNQPQFINRGVFRPFRGAPTPHPLLINWLVEILGSTLERFDVSPFCVWASGRPDGPWFFGVWEWWSPASY